MLNDVEPVVCPACSRMTEVTRIYSIPIDGFQLMLHDEVGEIYQCGDAECMSYLLMVSGKLEHIPKLELLKRQKDITGLIAAEVDIAKTRLQPRIAKVTALIKEGAVLSTALFRLTSESPYYRAYSVEEILDACRTLGLNPSKVGKVRFVLSWLREHKK